MKMLLVVVASVFVALPGYCLGLSDFTGSYELVAHQGDTGHQFVDPCPSAIQVVQRDTASLNIMCRRSEECRSLSTSYKSFIQINGGVQKESRGDQGYVKMRTYTQGQSIISKYVGYRYFLIPSYKETHQLSLENDHSLLYRYEDSDGVSLSCRYQRLVQ